MPSNLGPAEIVAILVVALIVLGPKRLPEAGRQVGKAIAEVRRWSQGFQNEVRTVIETEPEPVRAPSNGSSPGSSADGHTEPPVLPPSS